MNCEICEVKEIKTEGKGTVRVGIPCMNLKRILYFECLKKCLKLLK